MLAAAALVALFGTTMWPVAGTSGGVTPAFTEDLAGATFTIEETIDSSGGGCPTSGGGPTDTPPGVFVSILSGSTLLPGLPIVEDGEIVYSEGDPDHPDSFNVYSAVSDGGVWTGVIEPNEGSPPDLFLRGLCTTLLEIAEDGVSLDAASVERATFESGRFTVTAIAHGTTTTTASTTTSTTTAPTNTPASPPAGPVDVAPTFTG